MTDVSTTIAEMKTLMEGAVQKIGEQVDNQLKFEKDFEDMQKDFDIVKSKLIRIPRKIKLMGHDKIVEFEDDQPLWESEEIAKKFVEWMHYGMAKDFKKMDEIADQVQSWATEEQKTLVVDTPTAGGHLVPVQFIATLLRIADVFGQARPYCTVIPVKSNTINIPSLTSSVTVYWPDEAQDITESEPVFGLVELTTKKMATLTPVSTELIEDSTIGIATLLATLIGEALSREEDRVIFTGDTGAATPDAFMGVMKNASVATHTMTGSAYTDLTADDLLDMMALLTKSAQTGARFWTHPTLEHVLMKLKTTTGAYIYTQPQVSQPGKVWGYPLETSEVFPSVAQAAADSTIADDPFVLYGNLKHYLIADRRELRADVSQHIYFPSDRFAFRFIRRVAYGMGIPAGFSVCYTA